MEHRVWVPCILQQLPMAVYFTYGHARVSAALSNHPALSFPYCVHKSVLYVCLSFAALQIYMVFFFNIVPFRMIGLLFFKVDSKKFLKCFPLILISLFFFNSSAPALSPEGAS